MKILQCGVNEKRTREFKIRRSPRACYTFQLFKTAMIFEINHETVHVPADTVILFSTKDSQCFRSAEPWMINDYVLFEATDEEVKDLVFNKPLTVSNADYLHKILCLLYEELYSGNPMRDETVAYFFRALLSKINETNYMYNIGKGYTDKNAEFYALRNNIYASPHKKWQIEDMAKSCGLSTSRFQCVYKSLFSSTPMTDVISARIIMSKSLLKKRDYTIGTIASKCGYTSEAFFVRQFKLKTGKTPSEYRKNLVKY